MKTIILFTVVALGAFSLSACKTKNCCKKACSAAAYGCSK